MCNHYKIPKGANVSLNLADYVPCEECGGRITRDVPFHCRYDGHIVDGQAAAAYVLLEDFQCPYCGVEIVRIIEYCDEGGSWPLDRIKRALDVQA